MNNYKIKVNNEAESKEAQELFFTIGLIKDYFDDYEFPYYVASNDDETFTNYILGSDTSNWKELTLPQLRDLVVLHRNDVKDANYKQGMQYFFVSTENEVYWFNCEYAEWQDAEEQIDSLAPIQPEQGLISGADALRALADGEEVLWRTKTNAEVKSFRKQTPDLDLVLSGDCNYRFWIKPRTITMCLEIPAPFEPKDGEIFWILSTNYECGYVQILCYRNDEQGNRLTQFGAYRTEEEIKQVVAALRGGIKG